MNKMFETYTHYSYSLYGTDMVSRTGTDGKYHKIISKRLTNGPCKVIGFKNSLYTATKDDGTTEIVSDAKTESKDQIYYAVRMEKFNYAKGRRTIKRYYGPGETRPNNSDTWADSSAGYNTGGVDYDLRWTGDLEDTSTNWETIDSVVREHITEFRSTENNAGQSEQNEYLPGKYTYGKQMTRDHDLDKVFSLFKSNSSFDNNGARFTVYSVLDQQGQYSPRVQTDGSVLYNVNVLGFPNVAPGSTIRIHHEGTATIRAVTNKIQSAPWSLNLDNLSIRFEAYELVSEENSTGGTSDGNTSTSGRYLTGEKVGEMSVPLATKNIQVTDNEETSIAEPITLNLPIKVPASKLVGLRFTTDSLMDAFSSLWKETEPSTSYSGEAVDYQYKNVSLQVDVDFLNAQRENISSRYPVPATLDESSI